MKQLRQQHRSRSEIIASILATANGNRIRQTEILYKTYLSHTLLKDYLLFLIENDLLEYTTGDRTFKTTEKGMRFLRMYSQMNDLMIMKQQQVIQFTIWEHLKCIVLVLVIVTGHQIFRGVETIVTPLLLQTYMQHFSVNSHCIFLAYYNIFLTDN